MKRITDTIFVGDDSDYKEEGYRFDLVIQAAKEPWHREAVGYTGRGAPVGSPDYLWKYISGIPDRLILNLVDANDVSYISTPLMLYALFVLQNADKEGLGILVQCNKGVSRSPGLVFIHLYLDGHVASMQDFRERLYPEFSPGRGIEDWIKLNILSKRVTRGMVI